MAREGWNRHTQPFQHAQRPLCLPLASTVGLAVKATPFTPQQASPPELLTLELPQAFLSTPTLPSLEKDYLLPTCPGWLQLAACADCMGGGPYPQPHHPGL